MPPPRKPAAEVICSAPVYRLCITFTAPANVHVVSRCPRYTSLYMRYTDLNSGHTAIIHRTSFTPRFYLIRNRLSLVMMPVNGTVFQLCAPQVPLKRFSTLSSINCCKEFPQTICRHARTGSDYERSEPLCMTHGLRIIIQ